MGASKKPEMWLLVLLLCFGSDMQSIGISTLQVDCVVFNEDYLTCDWGSKQKPLATYSLYYWLPEKKPAECENYLRGDGIPVGCRFNFTLDGHTLYDDDFHIYVNSSGTSTSYSAAMKLINRVKVGSPINLSIEATGNNQLLLRWDTPYKAPWCLEHAVKYQSNKDTDWTNQGTTLMNFSVASMDPEKRYTFYVRSKLSNSCGTTDLWSEPTGPIHWGKESVSSMPFLVQISISLASLFLLVLLVLILMRMERVQLVLMPVIPNPSKKFEDLFTAYHGNFSEWAGVSKDAVESFKPGYRESICRVSELFPGGGYLPMSTEAGGKAVGVPGICAGPSPTANMV